MVAETNANVFGKSLRTWPDKQRSWGTPSNIQSHTNYLHDNISNFASGLFSMNAENMSFQLCNKNI